MMINFMPEKYNSILKLGNLVLRTNKKINLFHRIMFRLLLGIKVERKDKKMINFESVIIIKPNVKKEETINLVENFIKENGKLNKTDDLGIKKLAYEIQNFKEGQYVVFYFETETNVITKLEKLYRKIDDIMKFIVVKIED